MNVDFQAVLAESDTSAAQIPKKGIKVKPWIVLFTGTICLYFVAYSRDYWLGNADNLIGGVAYKNVAELVFVLEAILFVLYTMLQSRFELLQNIAVSISSGFFFLFLLEAIGHVVLGFDLVKSTPFVFRRFYIPETVTYFRPFPAGDLHPVAGRCHQPNSQDEFVNCEGDSIHWRYNSVGANDRERSHSKADPTKKRVAVIGDSFMEGYLVNEPDRCSFILERKTGAEHLNFAVNGSNPVHYYLTYKGIAKSFNPDIVLVGFLPANDFEMLTERQAYTRVDWPMYVPYWQGEYPNYTLRYSLANVNQSIFHGGHTNTSLLKVADSVYATLSLGSKLKADLLTHSSLFRLLGESKLNSYIRGEYTKYEQFTDEEWRYVCQSLTQLIKEAAGKQVVVVSLPTLPDLLALKQGKQNRVDPALAQFCRQQHVKFIPLAPAFLNSRQDLNNFYMACDGHWSKRGEAFAANTLWQNATYRAVLGL